MPFTRNFKFGFLRETYGTAIREVGSTHTLLFHLALSVARKLETGKLLLVLVQDLHKLVLAL